MTRCGRPRSGARSTRGALKCAADLGLTKIMRVDTCTPPALPEGMTYDEVKQFFVKNFREMAREAAQYGFDSGLGV